MVMFCMLTSFWKIQYISNLLKKIIKVGFGFRILVMATKLYTIIMTVTSAPDREGMQDRSAGLVNSCGRTVRWLSHQHRMTRLPWCNFVGPLTSVNTQVRREIAELTRVLDRYLDKAWHCSCKGYQNRRDSSDRKSLPQLKPGDWEGRDCSKPLLFQQLLPSKFF